MKRTKALIAEHHFLINWENPTFDSFLTKRFLQSESNLQADIEVTIYAGYGKVFQGYQVNISETEHVVRYERADYLLEILKDYSNATIHAFDELALKHAFTNLYSCYLVHHKYGLLIHSSCVKNYSKAHIFTGYSGAGKSTAAKLSYPRELLSDEASIVKISHEGITVFNSPFRSELEITGTEEAAPLASIQLLRQASYNERIQIKKSEAVLELMDKVFYWKRNSDEAKQIWYLLNALVQQVPIYELKFQKNNSFWELIS